MTSTKDCTTAASVGEVPASMGRRVLGTLHVPARGPGPAAPPVLHPRDVEEDEDADPVGPSPAQATHAA